MPPALAAAWGRAAAFVKGFSPAQRTIAIIGVAAVVLGGVALSSWLSRPSYAPLFTGLAATDASGIVNQLTADGIPYQITDGGGTIMVPQQDVYSERLKAAANNLPSTTTSGYALLDNLGVTASQFQQDVTYKQAMEQELANTIDAMNGVANSSVKLAIPTQSVFVQDQQDPTASVFVATQGSNALSSDQVQAIVHLVSASVPQMKAADVTVVDANGDVLSAAGADGSALDTGKAQTAYEQSTQKSIQDMLDKIVGPGNSTVAVAATISNQSAQQQSEQFTVPSGNPATQTQTSREQYTGSNAGSQPGVLGPDNIAVPNGTPTDGSYLNEQTNSTNAIDKTTTTTTTPPGAVQRQTVSVAINQSVASGLNLPQIQQLVANAAGYNKGRGDAVTVSVQPFSNVSKQTAQNALNQAANQQAAARRAQLIRTGIIAGSVAVAAVAIVALLLLRRRRGEGAVLDYQEVVAEDELQALLPGVEPEALEVLDPDADVDGIDAKKRDISALAAGDPARTAALLRGLMDQEVGS